MVCPQSPVTCGTTYGMVPHTYLDVLDVATMHGGSRLMCWQHKSTCVTCGVMWQWVCANKHPTWLTMSQVLDAHETFGIGSRHANNIYFAF
jgi:hypothetical protein